MAYYVYLLASKKHGTLYLGVTNDIVRRVYEHRTKVTRGFTSRYGVHKLVWFEIYDDAETAITREKELKKWRRDWKIRLIEEQNPEWDDLYQGDLQLTPVVMDSGPAPRGASRNDESREYASTKPRHRCRTLCVLFECQTAQSSLTRLRIPAARMPE
jgi:putative endonuclease